MSRARPADTVLTREQELWGVALRLEKTHGDEAPEHMAREVARLAASGDTQGIAMWRAVAGATALAIMSCI